MAAKRLLEIVANIRDFVTDKVDKMVRAMGRFDRQLIRAANNVKRFGKDIKQVGDGLLLFGGSLSGPLLLAFNSSAEYSQRVTDQLNRMKFAAAQLQLSIAEAMVPVMEKFTNILGMLLQKWNALDPALRSNIIQTVLIGGALATLGGVVLSITGRVIKFGAEIVSLAVKLTALALANWPLVLIAGTIVTLIVLWDKLKGVAIPVLNAIEIFANMVALGFHKMVSGMIDGTIRLANALGDMYRKLGSIQGPQQKLFLSMAEGLDQVAGKLRGVSQAERQTVQDLEGNIQKVLTRGQGALTGMFDRAHAILQQLKNFMKDIYNAQPVNIEEPLKAFDALEGAAQRTAQVMQSNMDDLFFNVMTARFENLKQVAINFGEQLLRIITGALARLAVFKMFGNVSIGGQLLGKFMHSGGMIRKAHSGMLAHDEVPIIAQTGEAVLSRRAVSALGQDNVYRLNNGAAAAVGGGGGPTTINYFITAVDAPSFNEMLSKNKASIHNIVAEGMVRNTTLRQTMKKYS